MSFRYRRRSFKRGRKLTTARIVANRSARAQSFQIAKLNKRISAVAKATRPEVLVKYVNKEMEFTNSAFSTNFNQIDFDPYYTSYAGDDDADADINLQGNFNRCKGISLKLVTQYSDNWRDTIADEAHDASAGYRVVILQVKRAIPIGATPSGSIGSIFNSTSNLSSADTNLTMPLVSGIGATYKVLYSKTFTINRYHPTRIHNIYIPGRKCLNFVKEVFMATDVSPQPKGHIIVAFLTGGLHQDIDYNSKIKIAATLKVAYTDN